LLASTIIDVALVGVVLVWVLCLCALVDKLSAYKQPENKAICKYNLVDIFGVTEI